MAREPKPWYRKDRRVWCVTIEGVRHNLGRDKKEAMRRFYALMRSPRRDRVVAGGSLLSVIDAFLDWTEKNRAAATYTWYRDHLQSFASRRPGLTPETLLPLHVEAWSAEGCENVNTRRNRMRAVKRCLRWAKKQGHVARDPLAGMEIPAAQPRDAYVPPEEFERLLGCVRDPHFADLLRVTYQTGCRPQELLRVEARHLDAEKARWVFPPGEAKVKSRPRIVYLSDEALALSKRLAERWPTGKLFRNGRDRPWTTDAVGCAFSRVQERMGRALLRESGETLDAREVRRVAGALKPTRTAGGVVVEKSVGELLGEARRRLVLKRAREIAPRYSLYALRHSWATNALKSGLDALTVAVLMGHSNPAQLACTYQHLAHDPGHLLAQARRVTA